MFLTATKKPSVKIRGDRITVPVPKGITEMATSVKVRDSVISDKV